MAGNSSIPLCSWSGIALGTPLPPVPLPLPCPALSEACPSSYPFALPYAMPPQVCRAQQLPSMAWLPEHIQQHPDAWRSFYDSNSPHDGPHPAPAERLNAEGGGDLLTELIIMRLLRPDKLVPVVKAFVTKHLGKKFTEPPLFNLGQIFCDSGEPWVCTALRSVSTPPVPRC